MWRRRGKASGIAQDRAGAVCVGGGCYWALSLFSPPLPPANNKVGVMVRMEEFDEDLAQNCPKLPRLAAWLLSAYLGAPDSEHSAETWGGGEGCGGGQECQRLKL